MDKRSLRTFPPLEVRFWPKVDKNGPIPEYAPHLGPCWIWTAAKSKGGYGQIGNKGKVLYAHRVSYEFVHGPLPDDRTHHIDHLCRVTACVNPDHLEWVPVSVNCKRGMSPQRNRERGAAVTHCPADHEYTEENTYITPDGGRGCKKCSRVRFRQWYAKNKKRQQAPDAGQEVANASPVDGSQLALPGL